MTRSELARVLFDLVQRKAITPEEMVETLRRFDAGELGDDLPIPATDEGKDDEWLIALALLLLLLGIPSVRSLGKQERERGRRLLRSRFEANTATLAASVFAGGPVARWHNSMANELSSYTRQMAIAGAGKMPKAATQAVVTERLSSEAPFLLGFATQITARRVGEREMSAAWINQRASSYGGTGWASYFISAEEQQNVGWVSRYISRDDRRTCSPCSDAGRNSPYLLGEGPFPGEICYGGGGCRCRRVTVYDPVAYARLRGNL